MKTINYQLSSQKCMEEGWTLRPPTPPDPADMEPDVFEPVLPAWAEGQAKVKYCINHYLVDGKLQFDTKVKDKKKGLKSGI